MITLVRKILKSINIDSEVLIYAGLVILLKLVYGLNGKVNFYWNSLSTAD